MPKYTIKITSKNNTALKTFLTLLKQKLSILKVTINLLKYLNKAKTIKKITVLKSPHINKTAQEKYAYKTYTYVIQTSSFQIQKYVLLLKKLKSRIFSEIKITISIENKAPSLKTRYLELKNHNLNWNNLKNIQKLDSKNSKRTDNNICLKTYLKFTVKTKNYLKIIDFLGENEYNSTLTRKRYNTN